MFFLSISLVLVFSLIFTLCIEKFSEKYNFLDKPNDRSSHSSPTPTLGGLAIVISFILYLLVDFSTSISNFNDHSILSSDQNIFFLFLLVIPISLIGLIDDINKVKVLVRLAIQFIVATLVVYYFQILGDTSDVHMISQQNILIFLISIILMVWLMNLYNFMDGTDGYAASECIFVTLGATLILFLNNVSSSLYSIILALSAATLGFLLRNLPNQAKIFMGDTGSVSIGFLLGFFIIWTASESLISIYTWLILLSIFISDSSYTLFVRIVTKKNITIPHTSHAFQKLAYREKTHAVPLRLMLITNLLWVLPMAILSNLLLNYNVIITLLTYVPIIFYMLYIGAGLEEEQR
ncbi:MAG: hypothetical protein CMD90_02985 [Gammaproteobacteria bacterium]|nr:hypothetical protein [Gammaproteobacteria bacterium]|tara:strand:+ start:220 stop:1269 length:1050 start_codon:yes stop_codon:yes gene_type:complete